jgi:hypothetical protein
VSPPDTCQRVYATIYDPTNPPPTVAQPTWVARIGAIDLVMLDSSSTNDTEVQNVEIYEHLGRRAVALLRKRGATGWLLTHRPMYGWERFGGPDSQPSWTNLTLEAALDPLIHPFAAVFSGHLHLFQTVEIPGRSAQLTLGDGGTLLDDADQDGPLPTFGPRSDVPGATPVPEHPGGGSPRSRSGGCCCGKPEGWGVQRRAPRGREDRMGTLPARASSDRLSASHSLAVARRTRPKRPVRWGRVRLVVARCEVHHSGTADRRARIVVG